MTLQQLEYVIALDNERHFVKASEKCFVTQPTLTMQVKKLEEEINTLIFDRKKQPLEPTEAGKQFIIKARQILRNVGQLKEFLHSDQESLEGTFKIGVIPTLAPYVIPLFINEFQENYPKTRLIIEEQKSLEIIENLNQNKIDIGILVTPLEERNIREIKLYNEPLRVYASKSHELNKLNSVSLEDITKYKDLWVLNEGNCFRNQTLNICSRPKQEKIRYESGSLETIMNILDNSTGFSVVPELSLKDRVKKGLEFRDKVPSREVSLVVHHSFTKEVLLEKLSEAILNQIPENYTKADAYIKVKWR